MLQEAVTRSTHAIRVRREILWQQWTTSETVHGVYSHHTKLQGKCNNPLYKYVHLAAFPQKKSYAFGIKNKTPNIIMNRTMAFCSTDCFTATPVQ